MNSHGATLWLLSLLLCVLAATVAATVEQRRKSSAFDVLIFTQHWPQTVCYKWKDESATHTCTLPNSEEWGIHGVWPTKYNTIGPQFCNGSLSFDIKALKPLFGQLNTKWIDVENGREPYSLWRHEWMKHGTCAVVLEQLNSEFKYFQEGLRLFDAYDMKHVLAKANIVPGQTYTVQDLFRAVQKVLGVRAQIVCVKNSRTGESYLFEIRICLDKGLRLVDCDGIANFPTNCDSDKRIVYPGKVPSNYQVVQS